MGVNYYKSVKDRHWKVYSIFVAIGLFVLSGFLVVWNWSIFQKTKESIELTEMSEANLASLNGKEEALKTKAKELETEDGLEKEIRERFPVAKPGEEVIMIVDNNNEAGKTSVITAEKNWWQKILDWAKL